ncbi:hypothetical protein FZI85_12300 [Mycobacterium sp. CBMA293]|uniref:hypothetical protein n=1 Tax=unclassified Mycolicibacterium TaxID=2636767 RepID=UPI0012DF6654|nr:MULTISPECIES: hypothetical protein [unclassified Mycolicibacterium]MUL47837.1 hypothetical protein [Mycolicibacterium sp. CBMA 360]MUL59316.1 hypothetical protein [Mycolicibacterium sp. CBMA 335]MUL71041.1 hypothetical protein [Mycolicibacterium sp. CBMA 311]MUL94684.1 hypothetical protein [Mycolicibacterium sp. CBMA 230]MUM09138.1 hypothetical protein [Mycolicibacterium sp. CBMA 213]
METLVVIAFILLVVSIVVAYAPQWWIGAVIFITFASLPTFVPAQIHVAGFGVYIHEVPLFLAALYLFINRPSNRPTDWCCAGILAITAAGVVIGVLNGNDVRATANDVRGLLAVALSVFIVGRISSTPQAQVALQAVKITLWVSFGFILLSLWGIVNLNVHSEDASLTGRAFHGMAGVERILGPTTLLASATVAISMALWAISPDLSRRTIGYFVPALGIMIAGYSRNALVVAPVTLLLAPLFHRSLPTVGRPQRHGAMLRAVFITTAGIAVFALIGVVLFLTAGIPELDGLRLIYAAYTNRVVDGFGSIAQHYDYSVLYRQGEILWLKSAIPGHELIGNGFGFRYRPPFGVGYTATSGTYYAHEFYWWAIAKVGWCGLFGYMITFVAPVAHAFFARGRFALRSAAGAAIVAYLITNIVVPVPEDVYGAPMFGALLGVALLVRDPKPTGGTSDAVVSDSQLPFRPRAHVADS